MAVSSKMLNLEAKGQKMQGSVLRMWNNLLLLCVFLLSGCFGGREEERITALVGTWYGYYPLYYAEYLQIPERYGYKLRIVEPTGILDMRRSYIHEDVDVFGVSMVEFAKAYELNKRQVDVLLASDYSAGGDVIVARKSLPDVASLNDAIIGVEANSLGVFVLGLAMDRAGLEDSSTKHYSDTQDYLPLLESGEIDAAVTYPPNSTRILANGGYHVLYSTEEDPLRVFDLLAVRSDINVDKRRALQSIWYDTVDAIVDDPAAYATFIAHISSVSLTQVDVELAGIKLIDRNVAMQTEFNQRVRADLIAACEIANVAAWTCQGMREGLRIW